MFWFLIQLALWLAVLAPTLLGTRFVVRRIRRIRCGMPLMVIVLLLAAVLTLLITPVALPMGTGMLPFPAIVAMAFASNIENGASLLVDVWHAYAPSGSALAITFLLTSAVLWLILHRKRR